MPQCAGAGQGQVMTCMQTVRKTSREFGVQRKDTVHGWIQAQQLGVDARRAMRGLKTVETAVGCTVLCTGE